MTPEEIKAFCESNAIRFVDVKFVDLFGQWQHITRPIHELNDWLARIWVLEVAALLWPVGMVSSLESRSARKALSDSSSMVA